MDISATSYQKNSYWYVKGVSATSPISSVISSNQSSGRTYTETSGLKQSSNVHSNLSSATVTQITGESRLLANGKESASDTDQNSSSVTNQDSTSGKPQQTRSADESQEGETSSSSADQESELSEDQLTLLKELKKADSEVRTHEMAHIAAGGQYVTSGAQLEYRKGPDGKSYAVAGEVSIDTSPISGDPEATAAKMRQVQRAALAPASPSSQDRKVAVSAGAAASKAMSEIITSQAKNRAEENAEKAFGNIQSGNGTSGDMRNAADSYSKIAALPFDPQVNQFKIAV